MRSSFPIICGSIVWLTSCGGSTPKPPQISEPLALIKAIIKNPQEDVVKILPAEEKLWSLAEPQKRASTAPAAWKLLNLTVYSRSDGIKKVRDRLRQSILELQKFLKRRGIDHRDEADSMVRQSKEEGLFYVLNYGAIQVIVSGDEIKIDRDVFTYGLSPLGAIELEDDHLELILMVAPFALGTVSPQRSGLWGGRAQFEIRLRLTGSLPEMNSATGLFHKLVDSCTRNEKALIAAIRSGMQKGVSTLDVSEKFIRDWRELALSDKDGLRVDGLEFHRVDERHLAALKSEKDLRAKWANAVVVEDSDAKALTLLVRAYQKALQRREYESMIALLVPEAREQIQKSINKLDQADVYAAYEFLFGFNYSAVLAGLKELTPSSAKWTRAGDKARLIHGTGRGRNLKILCKREGHGWRMVGPPVMVGTILQSRHRNRE